MAEVMPAHVSYVATELAENPDLRRLAWNADAWVRAMLGRWAGPKFIQWQAAKLGGEPAFDLRITEGAYSASHIFTRTEVGDERAVRRAALDLWGRLSDQTLRAELEGLKRFGEELKREIAIGRED